MSHSETCRKRFDTIEKKKLNKQLEEATRNAEPPLVGTVEMEVEQPQEHPMTGGAASSSGPTGGGTVAARMEITESSGSRRPLESSSKRLRSLAGMLLFDENDTSDWQHSILWGRRGRQ